jgi:hypothetical protein
MSWKQICDRYGQEEAASRVRAGTLKAKRDPEDKRFWLFMSVQETAKDSMNRVKKARVSTNTKLDRKTGANLQQALAQGPAGSSLDEVEELWDGYGEALLSTESGGGRRVVEVE